MISVVIPCFNEEAILPQLFMRMHAAANTWNEPYEIILVDDGSTDKTPAIAADFHAQDTRWKLIRLARNFGHQIAVSAGIYYAKGAGVAVLDADLQDPPEELHRFIEQWRSGYEVVYAVRTKRKEHILKRMCYTVFYRILGSLADINIPYDAGDFCVMDRKVVDLLNAMPERNRFVRGLRAWVGFKQIGLTYERSTRTAGHTQYTVRKLIHLALDGIFSFSTVPLRIATYMGFIVSGMALMGAFFTLIQRIFSEFFWRIGWGPVPGFATTVIAILFLGGVQLICLGIIGEYLGRMYDEIKGRPIWTIQQLLGIES